MLAVHRLAPCARSARLWTLLTPEKRRASARKCVAPQSFRSHSSESAYSRAFTAARDDPERFWGEAGSLLNWFEPWRKTLHVEDPVFPNWWVSREQRERGTAVVVWGMFQVDSRCCQTGESLRTSMTSSFPAPPDECEWRSLLKKRKQ